MVKKDSRKAILRRLGNENSKGTEKIVLHIKSGNCKLSNDERIWLSDELTKLFAKISCEIDDIDDIWY